MSDAQIFTLLESLGLGGCAKAYERQLSHPEFAKLPFAERLYGLLCAEQSAREGRRVKYLLSLARFKDKDASLQQLEYGESRNLDPSLLLSLASNSWIERQQNILITGPTGAGKSFLAQALGRNAIHEGHTVRYYRVSLLLEEIRVARHAGHYTRTLTQLSRYKLLILDDFGVSPLKGDEVTDLFEVIEERTLRGSTIVTAQLPLKEWHAYLGNETIADAILDRIIHRSHKIELDAKDSMRKIMALKENKENHSDTQATIPEGYPLARQVSE